MASQGISKEDYERALADAHKTKWDVIKEVAWDVLKEISGWNDIVDCFTKGDIWGCAGMVAGLVPWGKVGKILEAGWNAIKAVDRLTSIVSKAQGVLRRVQGITERVTQAVTEKFQKLGSRGGDVGESCVLHSFVGATLVLMADGSTKPISEVEIGDEVKATDPATGETTDREVVATIVHNDEGDMTKLTVAGEDGTTGSVSATSWHPVWVDAEGRFVNIGDLEPGQRLASADGGGGGVPTVTDVDRYTHYEPVYDLTVEGVHTYYVLAGTTPVLVHNCGNAVSVKQVKMAVGRADMSVSQYDIVHVPEIRTTGDGIPAYGNSPHDGNGRPNLGPRGRPVIQISDMGLADMDTAVATIFHEVYHHRMYATRRSSMGGTEADAEAYGQAMLGVFRRRTS